MFLEVSCMALLNAHLPYKTNAKLASAVLCFVTPQDRKGKFQKPIICAVMQDRGVIYAKSQLGSFFGNKEQSGFAPRNRKDGTHKTGENRMSWGRTIRIGKKFV